MVTKRYEYDLFISFPHFSLYSLCFCLVFPSLSSVRTGIIPLTLNTSPSSPPVDNSCLPSEMDGEYRKRYWSYCIVLLFNYNALYHVCRVIQKVDHFHRENVLHVTFASTVIFIESVALSVVVSIYYLSNLLPNH